MREVALLQEQEDPAQPLVTVASAWWEETSIVMMTEEVVGRVPHLGHQEEEIRPIPFAHHPNMEEAEVVRNEGEEETARVVREEGNLDQGLEVETGPGEENRAAGIMAVAAAEAEKGEEAIPQIQKIIPVRMKVNPKHAGRSVPDQGHLHPLQAAENIKRRDAKYMP